MKYVYSLKDTFVYSLKGTFYWLFQYALLKWLQCSGADSKRGWAQGRALRHLGLASGDIETKKYWFSFFGPWQGHSKKSQIQPTNTDFRLWLNWICQGRCKIKSSHSFCRIMSGWKMCANKPSSHGREGLPIKGRASAVIFFWRRFWFWHPSLFHSFPLFDNTLYFR